MTLFCEGAKMGDRGILGEIFSIIWVLCYWYGIFSLIKFFWLFMTRGVGA
jgi:hypothetical protein